MINYGNINYQAEVKERISELNLNKAVQKGTFVYCFFIVLSDSLFFKRLAADIKHYKRECKESKRVVMVLMEPTPIEYMSDSYQEDCYREDCRLFSRMPQLFCKRYGIENVINTTVHVDEAAPHMHLGIVSFTKDGRLSAKDIFTRAELKNLQTDLT